MTQTKSVSNPVVTWLSVELSPTYLTALKCSKGFFAGSLLASAPGWRSRTVSDADVGLLIFVELAYDPPVVVSES